MIDSILEFLCLWGGVASIDAVPVWQFKHTSILYEGDIMKNYEELLMISPECTSDTLIDFISENVKANGKNYLVPLHYPIQFIK
ncbi:hypothetical protein U3516DRAFT_760413 [Neocallimastix sp. 'constans']